ncbi:hypothetical protein L499_A0145 [Bordetella holmesii CDC-H635-BH]|uniref:Large ribosomal RNA subunit accumulation protein YceD n=1 Tax=Bordetella holmesii CDC-H585-BH TaxID=1331206 RepID=A0A158MAF6_9BORD|nr:hypothetical protein D558_2283 [Bordetella holmesii 44057]EWM51695.1 hypothetical protein D557_1557 [Bordetella holmesii 70147]KAK77799.1 hypothetical protein L503_0143 [Bordetella holmesii CDC-H809-BH]KAK81964.1 hypothetical protein L496_0141 [Bordetella holmesii CDC-H572-BH]KAK90890.1 hypothetical protein L499_A0145 [Bordetella holmesii CDC-H635-BH]KAL00868.1 hypothetical protein L497_0144 [Bordetella holmesii CDC-H585-BH]KCV00182.1 hypothetical protein L501_0145 [Bordetella holmesii CDC
MDAYAMARQGQQASGEIALARLSRFMEGLPEQAAGDAGIARWSVVGEVGKGTGKSGGVISGQPLLRLHIEANPVLICQRCNAPFVHPVDSEVVLQLVESEDDLDDELADLQDAQEEGLDFAADVPEKVVGSHRFDLLAQIEDELILSIPYVPRHDICPDASGQAVGKKAASGDASQASEVKRPSPFAVLEQLKRKN